MVNKYDNKMFSGKYNYNTKCSFGGLRYLCVCMCAFVFTDMWLYSQWTRIKKRKPLKQSGSPWPQLLHSDPFHLVPLFDYDKMPLGDHSAQKTKGEGEGECEGEEELGSGFWKDIRRTQNNNRAHK